MMTMLLTLWACIGCLNVQRDDSNANLKFICRRTLSSTPLKRSGTTHSDIWIQADNVQYEVMRAVTIQMQISSLFASKLSQVHTL